MTGLGIHYELVLTNEAHGVIAKLDCSVMDKLEYKEKRQLAPMVNAKMLTIPDSIRASHP